MKTRLFLISMIIGVLFFSLTSASLSHAENGNNHLLGPAASTYEGNITIEPDGFVAGTGITAIPIVHSGDSYTLTGQINGTLTILHNNSVFNGNNYTVKPYFHTQIGLGAVNIINDSNVKLSNLNVSSENAWYGVYLNNTSYDLLNHITQEYSYAVGFEVLNYTHNVEISNSTSNQSYINVFLGGYFSPYSSNFPVSSGTSSNDTLYNFTAIIGLGGIVVGGNYMKVLDSSSMYAESAFFSVANNTLFEGNKVNFSDAYIGFSIFTLPGTNSFHNVSFINNNVFGPLSSFSSGSAMVIENSTGTISGNTFNINASGHQIKTISIHNSTYSVSGNTINLTDVGGNSTNPSSGIGFLGSNYSVMNNQLSLTGNYSIGIGLPYNPIPAGMNTSHDMITGNSVSMNVKGGEGVLLNGSNSLVSDNVIAMNSTNGTIGGISLNGFNDVIESNAINMSFYNSNPTNSTGIGNISGLSSNSGNITVADNSISFSIPSLSLFKENIFSGIQFIETGASNFSITGNTVISPINDTLLLSGPAGILVSIKSGLTVSYNTIQTPTGIIAQANNTEVSRNDVTFGNDGIGFGGTSIPASNISILDNTFSSAYEEFTLSGDEFTNATIAGNYFYAGGANILLEDATNISIYHNDFFNASAYFIDITYPGTIQNLRMNSSYPVGGNYYAGLAITDKFSGASQNIAGADGIGDNPYSIPNTTYIDHYPLAKPWLRPQFTIHEAGLVSGTVWSATFNGQTKTSDSASISFNVVNATFQTYSYSYARVDGYAGSGSGTYDYTGGNSSSFTAVYSPYYTVNFTESGFPGGASWQISINGTLKNVTQSYLELVVTNGTSISYNVHNTTMYYATPFLGHFTVSGNTTVRLAFSHYAYLVGSVLPVGAIITVGGANVSLTSNGSFNVTLTAGTYQVVVSDNGYQTLYRNITLNPGQTLALPVKLNKTTSGGLPTSTIEAVGIGAAIVVIIALIIFLRIRK